MLLTLFIIILVEGFITISVEILAIRQLVPFFGNSVIITSIIIGIFLLFLSVGYWRGGMYKNDFLNRLRINFTIAMIFIGFGLSYLFIASFYYLTLNILHLPITITLFIYLLLTLSPTVYFLGQTVPLTTNLFNKEKTVAGISGQALFISTLGSFLGAVLTTLLLFHYVGVGFTVFFNCLLLLLLIIHIQIQTQFSLLNLIILLITLTMIYIVNHFMDRQLFIQTNNYANYQVTENLTSKILRINHNHSSQLNDDKTGAPYIELIKNILFNQLHIKNSQILVIGAGGFSLSFEKTMGNQFTYVDIDKAIKDIAEQHFLKDSIKGQFVGMDARQFMRQNHQTFDIVISDAYTSLSSIPPSLATHEFYQQTRHLLKDNGLFIANIIANPYFQDPFSKKINNTIHSVYPYCRVVPLNWHSKTTNIIYICTNVSTTNTIYTDDLNTVTLDYFYLAH